MKRNEKEKQRNKVENEATGTINRKLNNQRERNI